MGLLNDMFKRRPFDCEGARIVPRPVKSGTVQVLGTGCRKCHQLYENAVAVLGEDGVEYVTDMARIAESGILTLPALVVDGKPVNAGKLLTVEEIAQIA